MLSFPCTLHPCPGSPGTPGFPRSSLDPKPAPKTLHSSQDPATLLVPRALPWDLAPLPWSQGPLLFSRHSQKSPHCPKVHRDPSARLTPRPSAEPSCVLCIPTQPSNLKHFRGSALLLWNLCSTLSSSVSPGPVFPRSRVSCPSQDPGAFSQALSRCLCLLTTLPRFVVPLLSSLLSRIRFSPAKRFLV